MRATPTGLPLSIELDLGEFLAVLFNQRSELPQQFAAVGGRHFAPGTFIEGTSGRLDGTVDILRVGFGDLRQDGPGRRIIIGECLARGGIDQLAINKSRLRRPTNALAGAPRRLSSAPVSVNVSMFLLLWHATKGARVADLRVPTAPAMQANINFLD